MKIFNISILKTFNFSTVKWILDHFLLESRNVFCIYMTKKGMSCSILCLRIFSLSKKLFNYVNIIIINISMFLSKLIKKFTEKEVFIIIFYKLLQL